MIEKIGGPALRRVAWVCAAILILGTCIALLVTYKTPSGGEGAPGAALSALASGPAATEERVSWVREVLSYVTLPFLLTGAVVALQISALAMLGGLILGLGLALMRLSRFFPVRAFA